MVAEPTGAQSTTAHKVSPRLGREIPFDARAMFGMAHSVVGRYRVRFLPRAQVLETYWKN